MTLTLGPRPRLRDISLGRLKTDVLFTLQRDEEGVERIGEACQQAGIEWHHYPLDSRQGHMSPGTHYIAAAQSVAKQIELGRSVHLHCAAGIHRTGMVAYGALRLGGRSHEDALAWIQEHRPVIITNGSEKIQAMERFLGWLTCGTP